MDIIAKLLVRENRGASTGLNSRGGVVNLHIKIMQNNGIFGREFKKFKFLHKMSFLLAFGRFSTGEGGCKSPLTVDRFGGGVSPPQGQLYQKCSIKQLPLLNYTTPTVALRENTQANLKTPTRKKEMFLLCELHRGTFSVGGVAYRHGVRLYSALENMN